MGVFQEIRWMESGGGQSPAAAKVLIFLLLEKVMPTLLRRDENLEIQGASAGRPDWRSVCL